MVLYFLFVTGYYYKENNNMDSYVESNNMERTLNCLPNSKNVAIIVVVD